MIDLSQAVLIFGSATLGVTLFCFIFYQFAALKKTPSIRASWVAGLSYILTSIIFWFSAADEYVVLTPFAAMPAGTYAFWSFQADFRRAWIEDPDKIPEGAILENDDWKSGFLRLALMFITVFCAAIGGRIGGEIMQGLLG